MTKRPPSLLDIAVHNLRSGDEDPGAVRAMVQASKALTVPVQLVICANSLGYWPTQREYALWWGVRNPDMTAEPTAGQLRSAQREWALFRNVFPGEDGPERMARYIADQMPSKVDAPRAAQLPAGAFVNAVPA